jgi:hypothetical protein
MQALSDVIRDRLSEVVFVQPVHLILIFVIFSSGVFEEQSLQE